LRGHSRRALASVRGASVIPIRNYSELVCFQQHRASEMKGDMNS
jgi:hypothetical protein